MELIFQTILQLISLHTLLLFILHTGRIGCLSTVKIEKRNVDVNSVGDGSMLSVSYLCVGRLSVGLVFGR